MTYPRSHIVAEGESGFFHVVSRCVRRAFLCGQDQVTGQNYEHRRQWIEARILELADCFCVSVYAYAVAQARTKGRFAGTARSPGVVPSARE
jgi:hypothetical protein